MLPPALSAIRQNCAILESIRARARQLLAQTYIKSRAIHATGQLTPQLSEQVTVLCMAAHPPFNWFLQALLLTRRANSSLQLKHCWRMQSVTHFIHLASSLLMPGSHTDCMTRRIALLQSGYRSSSQAILWTASQGGAPQHDVPAPHGPVKPHAPCRVAHTMRSTSRA